MRRRTRSRCVGAWCIVAPAADARALTATFCAPTPTDGRPTLVVQALSFISETAVFIYIGHAVAGAHNSCDGHADSGEYSLGAELDARLIGVVFGSALLSRAAHILPLSMLSNRVAPGALHITPAIASFMCFSGLRGAISFALAAKNLDDEPNAQTAQMAMTTNVVVLITSLLQGSLTAAVLRWLGLISTNGGAGAHDGGDAAAPTSLPYRSASRWDHDAMFASLSASNAVEEASSHAPPSRMYDRWVALDEALKRIFGGRRRAQSRPASLAL